MKNQTVIIRTRKDKDPKNNPYLMVSMSIFKSNLNGYEKAIMFELLGNADNWTINKCNIEKRLDFPHKKFNDAWKSLEDKHYITCERFFGGVKWIINEDPKANPNDYIQESNELVSNSTTTDVSNVEFHNVLDSNSTYTDISNTDISNTDDHLINNKEINNNYNNLKILRSKAGTETFKTNNINLDKSKFSPLDLGINPKIQYKENNIDNFVYSMSTGLTEMDIDMNFIADMTID